MKTEHPFSGLVILAALPLIVLMFMAGFGLMVSTLESSLMVSNQRATATAATQAETNRHTRQQALATQAATISFSQDVLPILQARCVLCHGPNSIAGAPPNGLQLDTYDNVMLGSLFLPVVNPGAPDKSTLILLLRSGAMPAQSEPLATDQINLIARWIAAGAPDN